MAACTDRAEMMRSAIFSLLLYARSPSSSYLLNSLSTSACSFLSKVIASMRSDSPCSGCWLPGLRAGSVPSGVGYQLFGGLIEERRIRLPAPPGSANNTLCEIRRLLAERFHDLVHPVVPVP